MNDRIWLGFRKEKALAEERILSEMKFLIQEVQEDDKHTDVCYDFKTDETLYDRFLSALSDYILSRYERKLLKQILNKQYGIINPFQQQEIVLYINELEKDAALCRCARINAIRQGLDRYFSENSEASVEGLVMFRLKRYETLIKDVAEELFEIYSAHKEYQEFIALLRYFVGVQVGRPEFVHLICHNQEMYSIFNCDEEDITAECIADFAKPEEVCAENFDDLLISILITLAPERIVVHNRDCIRNKELFETIEKVFEKIEYCKECKLCKTTDNQIVCAGKQ